MNTAYFYLTPEGEALALRLSAGHPGDLYGKDNFRENLRTAFSRYENLICIMATGIVVRILAPLLVHKSSDPAVVVMDQKGRHAISLLSGHLGGANDLAREMAFLAGGEPVITTATDVAGLLSFDTFAKSHEMAIENIRELKHVSGALLSGKPILVVTDCHFPEVEDLVSRKLASKVSVSDYVSNKSDRPSGKTDTKKEPEAKLPTVIIDESLYADGLPGEGSEILVLRPRTICAGIGCKRGMDGESIIEALSAVLKETGLAPRSLEWISTIPLKAYEPGIQAATAYFETPLTVISTEEIEKLDISSLGIAPSDFVAQQTGVLSVSAASSFLAAEKGLLLRDKVKFKGVTIALSKHLKYS